MSEIKPTVLVVEDDGIDRALVGECIEASGYCALQAHNAEAAIILLETRSDVQLVFTDVEMSGRLDGIELAHLVRERWPSIRLLVASGSALFESIELPSGARFFRKPYRGDAIAAAVGDLLAGV